MLRKSLAIGAWLVSLLAVSAVAAAVEDKAPKAPIVQVEPAAPVQLEDAITYPARVVSKVKAAVYAPGDGVVTRVLTPLGTLVRAGAYLIEIKNIDPVYEYVPVKVDTPVAGVVSSVEVTAGTKVVKGQALATVTDPRQIELVIEVPAADVGAFKKDLQGSFTLPMLGDRLKPLAAKVTGVSPLVDPVTGTATAELSLAPPPGGLLIPPGAIGKVVFSLNKRRGIQVLEQAIVYRGKETLVRTVVDGKAKLTPVTVGETRKGKTEVLSGLKDGAVVVVRASGFVADGQAVTVENGDVAKR